MNYFPYLHHFKNTNLYSLPFSLPYGYQSPFLLPNQLSLTELQFNSELWKINNEFIQNIKHQISDHDFKSLPTTPIPSQKDSSSPITCENKKNADKNKLEKKAFKQKEGRNMISNLFRQALKCMLLEKDKTIELIQKVSEKYRIDVNPKEFLEGISKKLKNLKNYVRIGQIEMFLKGKENGKSKQHAKVLRILVNRFLREQVIPCLCNNPKVQKNNRFIHILERRKFNDLISLS